ncbi:MAG: CvpA family protein [Clostridia bacterium]|nr:CvpA family protein [Clostridia bacterium]
MAFLIDLILVFILALCVYIGWVRGFVKTLSGFLIYVVSFAFANASYHLITKYTIMLPFLQKLISDVEMPVFSEKATFLDKLGEIVTFAKDTALTQGAEEAVEATKAVLGNCVAELLAAVIAFILIFLVSILLLKLLIWIFDAFVTKLPVLRQANGLLGGIVGLFNGFIWTWALSNIFVRIVLPLLHHVWPNVFIYEIADSFVVNLCTKINPITYLFELINLIS